MTGLLRRGSRLAPVLAVYLAYQLIAVGFFGTPLLPHLANMFAGSGPDPQFMLWTVAWWPYALSHHLNLLYTKLLWAPEGFNLIWSTSNLLQGLVIAPITTQFGPIVALNLLDLVSPALSALAAFLLVRRMVGKIWPALLGGYLYGFSPFIVGHQAGAHLFATAVFLIPAAIALVLRHWDGRLGARSFVVLLTMIVICQFLLGLELAATAALFGMIALAVAWTIWRDRRDQIRRTTILVLISLGSAAVVLSPLLLRVLAVTAMGRHRVWPDHGVDLFELLVPGNLFLMGRFLGYDKFSTAYDHFPRDLGGYVGLPILIIAALFFRSRPRAPSADFLGAMLAITYVAALGPSLHFGGRSLVVMPWRLFDGIPFINSAQAARFAVYFDLILAIIVAIWIAEVTLHLPVKVAIAALIVFSIMPNFLDRSLWATTARTPKFISSGELRDHLKPGENVLVLPFGPKGHAMAWQTMSGMYFGMPEGWTGPTPPSFAAWPIMDVFEYGIDIPEKQAQLNAFMAAHGATAVVIDRDSPDAAKWMELIDSRNARIEELDEVVVVRPSPESLDAFEHTTATAMQCRRDELRLPALIAAADGYVKAGYPLDQLTPRAAEDRGLLPPDWVEAEDRGMFTRAGVGLGEADGNRVMVGVKTAAQCARRFANRYYSSADEIRFPFPHLWGAKKVADERDGKFVLIFSRGGLAKTAEPSRPPSHQAEPTKARLSHLVSSGFSPTRQKGYRDRAG